MKRSRSFLVHIGISSTEVFKERIILTTEPFLGLFKKSTAVRMILLYMYINQQLNFKKGYFVKKKISETNNVE